MQNDIIGAPANIKKNLLLPIIIIGVFYFILGFITWLNGILIPYLRVACELTYSQALWVALAFYISYAVMAVPASYILKRTGFKNGMSLGLAVMAIGALIFIPAANGRDFTLFLIGLFIQGTGMTILQTAINPYVTILGPIESAAKRISIMGICNKVAGIIGPIILAFVLLKDFDKLTEKLKSLSPEAVNTELNALADRVILPYVVMAGALVVLAIIVMRLKSLPDVSGEDESVVSNTENRKKSIFSFPYLWLGFVSIFLYVGVEVIAGDTIINYANSYWNIEMSKAQFFTSLTLAAMILGYFIGVLAIPKLISQEKALTVFSITGIIFSLLVIFLPGMQSVTFLALLGFSNSIMWPAIWPLAIDGLGKFIKTGSAILIIGIAGGAVLPKLHGIISEQLGGNMQQAYWVLVPGYLFILFFALMGHKIGKTKK